MSALRLHQAAWLALYDLKSLWRERGPLWLLVVAIALALFALAQGAQFQVRLQQAAQAAATQESTARADAAKLAQAYFASPADAKFADLKWWRNPADIRGYAFREHLGYAIQPALPGAALAVGQADVLPAYVRVRAESMESAASAYEIEHPARLAAGRFDLMFFIVYLWPLVLVALGSSVLTQERETGRLSSLKLQGVATWRLLLAQVLARTLGATGLMVGAVVAAALLTGAVAATAGGVAALANWAGIVALYAMFWAAVVSAVCAVCGQRSTSAFAGFGAWVLFAVLAPALLTAAVSLAAPVPSRELYVDAARQAADRVNANRVQMLERFYDEHPQWRPAKTAIDKLPAAVTRFAREQEQERLLADVSGRFERARAQRESLFANWSWLSPVTQASDALARVAGTDAQRHRSFTADALAHQKRLRAFFHERIQQAALRDEQAPCPSTCQAGYGFVAFDEVPQFVPSSALLQATRADGVALAAWALLLMVGVLLALRLGLAVPGQRLMGNMSAPGLPDRADRA